MTKNYLFFFLTLSFLTLMNNVCFGEPKSESPKYQLGFEETDIGGEPRHIPFTTRFFMIDDPTRLFDFSPKYEINFGDGQTSSVIPEHKIAASHLNRLGNDFSDFYYFGLPHTYPSFGTYNVELTKDGHVFAATTLKIMENSSLFFKASLIRGVSPLSVTFSVFNCSRAASIVDFGDGSKAEVSPTSSCNYPSGPLGEVAHVYSAPGTYVAKELLDASGPVIEHITITVLDEKPH